MKVVGILGASFCGSTALSMACSTLPGVIAPGEIHWLRDKKAFTPHFPTLCSTCSPDPCPVITKALSGRITNANAYDLIAEAFGGADVLVSSDKSTAQYSQYVQQPDLYIWMVRNPVTHVVSLAEILGNERVALDTLKTFYEHELGAAGAVPTVRVDLEGFAADAFQGLVKLHGDSGGVLPMPDSVPLPQTSGHQCGGNIRAYPKWGGAKKFDPAVPNRRVPKELNPGTIVAEMTPILARL